LFKQVLPEEQASQNVSVIRKVRKNAEQDSAAKSGALDLEEAKK
jgi:hypothetical protein